MKIAVLVLAHKNPEQLRQLIQRLCPDFDVYIHIDGKAAFEGTDLGAFRNTKTLKRHRISWGSFSMVQATLDLIRLAGPANYERFVLISGQDLPIKSNSHIKQFYAEHKGTNFVESLNLRDWDTGGLERVTQWHLRSPTGTKGLTRNYLRAFGFGLSAIQKRLGYTRRMDWDFYCGPQWVDLTGETAESILRLVDDRPDFLKRFRGTTCSDEIFFQTAIHFLGLEGTCASTHTRYIDWETGPESPRTLRLEDEARLASSSALFARKFDADVDREIMNRVLNS